MVPGRVLRSASLPPLTREAIIAFAREYDPQPQHMGEDSAAKSNLGVFCASGWHTGSLTMRLLVDTVPIKGGGMGAGVELKWPRPVVVGDVLRVEIEVLEARPVEITAGQGRGDVPHDHVQPARRAGAVLHAHGAVSSAWVGGAGGVCGGWCRLGSAALGFCGARGTVRRRAG